MRLCKGYHRRASHRNSLLHLHTCHRETQTRTPSTPSTLPQPIGTNSTTYYTCSSNVFDENKLAHTQVNEIIILPVITICQYVYAALLRYVNSDGPHCPAEYMWHFRVGAFVVSHDTHLNRLE